MNYTLRKLISEEVDGYYYDKNSSFVIIYGMDVETSEKGLYIYDKDKQTLQRYNDEYANDLQAKIELYSYIIIGFCAVFLIMLIIIIVLARKKGKKKKKGRKSNE